MEPMSMAATAYAYALKPQDSCSLPPRDAIGNRLSIDQEQLRAYRFLGFRV